MKRWIDLSPYGLKLRIVILPTTRAFVLEGADAHRAAATTLGFKRRSSGAWVKEGTSEVNPRDFIRVFPEATVREMPDEDYITRVNPHPPAAAVAAPGPSTAADAAPVAVGVNRMGHSVFEDARGRFAVDGRGRHTHEAKLVTPAPGFFLRATDDAALRECADGYVEQCARQPDAVGDVGAFAATVGLPGDAPSLARLSQAIAASAARAVGKSAGGSMAERFARAADVQKGLDRGMPSLLPLPLRVAVRRMMGTDPELLGVSLAADGSRASLIVDLAPRGSRRADAGEDPDIRVDAPPAASALVGPGLRADFAEALGRIAGREADARTFLVLEEADGVADGGPEAAVAAIARTHRVEAAARVARGAGGRPMLVVAVGGRRAPGTDAPPVRVADVGSDAELWTFASEAAVARSRLVEAALAGDASALASADPSLARSLLQTPYVPLSRAGAPSTMVPRELEGPTRAALTKVAALYGDVDRKVCIEFGIPQDRLGEVFSPEQVDGLALTLHAEERGRAMIVADSTGVGKGRMLAALMRRAVLSGRPVLVLTEKEENLSDLLRDVHHIGADDVVLPTVLNDAQLVDERTGKPFRTGDRKALLDAVAQGRWPEGARVVFATHSQFNQALEESPRAAWLRAVVDEETVLLLDEVHNAASGESNTSENLGAAVDAAGSVVFSSATFAATPKMVGFYGRAFPEGISSEEIVAMMRKGGDQFQEVVSAMLVADGVMVRREKDLSGIEFLQLVDAERMARNHDHMDRLAGVMAEMAALSGDLDRWAAAENGRREAAPRREGVKSLQMRTMAFGSPLHTMTRLFVSSLLAEHAAERAVAALEAGEKPVVLVDNTIQSIMEGLAADGGGALPDFRDVVHRVLTQITTVRDERADGTTAVALAAERADGGLAATVVRIRAMIDDLPPLPASAIDLVKNRIADAGFTCGEITGRTLEIRGGRIVPRSDRNRTKTKNDFNSGALDAVVINSAGSTGIDLHSGRRFRDRRRRALIELQGPAHVLRQIQAYGRVDRRDQESAPRIELLSTGLPIEARLAAMRNVKLRRLSANVSSNRDSAYLTTAVPDLLNPVGDTVVARYAKMRPDLMRKLCLLREDEAERTDAEVGDGATEPKEDREERDQDRSANELLSRLMLLPTAHQERILGELVAEYRAHVEELEARGENPLRPREMEGVVHVLSSRVFEGAMSTGSDSAFDGPLHLSEVAIERVAEPIRADAVMAELEVGMRERAGVARALRILDGGIDDLVEPFLPARAKTVPEAVRLGVPGIVRMLREAGWVGQAIREIVPGRQVTLSLFGETKVATVVSVSAPKPGFEHLAHLYGVDLAVPGDTAFRRFRLSTLLSDPAVAKFDEAGNMALSVAPGLEGDDYDAVLDAFEEANATTKTYGRILTGNVFRAVRMATEHGLGKLVSFVDADGVRHRGVLVRRDFHKRLDMLEMRIEGKEAALAALVEYRAELNTSPHAPERGVLVTPLGSDAWTVRLPARPKRAKGAMWEDAAFADLHAEGQADDKGRSRVRVDGAESLSAVLDVLCEAGLTTFYASAKHRRAMDGGYERQMPERMVA